MFSEKSRKYHKNGISAKNTYFVKKKTLKIFRVREALAKIVT